MLIIYVVGIFVVFTISKCDISYSDRNIIITRKTTYKHKNRVWRDARHDFYARKPTRIMYFSTKNLYFTEQAKAQQSPYKSASTT